MNLVTNRDPYNYDEADYMYAAQKGLIANYLDANAIPIQTFIESGLNMGNDKTKRTDLSELIRNSDDITFYRHYHGPLYFYWLNVLHFIGCKDENSFRAGTLALLALTGFVLLWAVSKQRGITIFGLCLPIILLFGSEINIDTSAFITPHALYVAASLAAVAMLSHFFVTNKKSDWYKALTLLGLAFLSIEYAVLVALTFLLCLVIERKSVFPLQEFKVYARFAGQALLVLLLTIGVFWLGGIVKLTLVKNYIFFAYFTFVRGGEYGNGNFIDVWLNRFSASPVLFIIVILTLIYFVVKCKENRHLLPFVIYPALVFLTSIRNTSPLPTYVSSILPPIFVLSGVAFSQIFAGKKYQYPSIAILLIIGGLEISLLPTLGANNRRDENTNQVLINYLNQLPASDSSMLVPRLYLPTLHFYFPDKHWSAYREEFDDINTVRLTLARKKVNGFLYVGSVPKPYDDVLRKMFASVHLDTLTHPPQNQKVLYYKLRM